MKNMNFVMFMLIFSSLSISAMDAKKEEAARILTAKAKRLKRAQNIANDDVNPHNRHAERTAGKEKDIAKEFKANKF